MEWSSLLDERDTQWDSASLYDIDSNGIPELMIRTDYGIEQADIFTYANGQVTWLGTMGGDNFFQDIFYYPGSSNTGLFAALGGPAMSIRNCQLEKGRFSCTMIATTAVDWESGEMTDIRMNVRNDAVYNLLYGTFVGNRDTSVSLRWCRSSSLQNDADWRTLFGSVIN